MPADLSMVGKSAGTCELATPISHVGRFSFLAFSNPLRVYIKDMRVLSIAPDFLFKSVLAWCAELNVKTLLGS